MATSFKLKRKNFAFLGIGNVAKNWKAAEGAMAAGKIGKGLASGAKSLTTGGLYTVAGVTGLGLAGAGYAAKKGTDLLTGQEAAKQ